MVLPLPGNAGQHDWPIPAFFTAFLCTSLLACLPMTEGIMSDVLFVGLILALFVASVALVRGLQRLHAEGQRS